MYFIIVGVTESIDCNAIGLTLPTLTFFEFLADTKTRGHSLKLIKNDQSMDLRLHFFSETVK